MDITAFKQLKDTIAILHCNGVYKECPVCIRGQYVYAKVGNGYIRLYSEGYTSNKSRLHELIISDEDNSKFLTDKFGRFIFKESEDAQTN